MNAGDKWLSSRLLLARRLMSGSENRSARDKAATAHHAKMTAAYVRQFEESDDDLMAFELWFHAWLEQSPANTADDYNAICDGADAGCNHRRDTTAIVTATAAEALSAAAAAIRLQPSGCITDSCSRAAVSHGTGQPKA